MNHNRLSVPLLSKYTMSLGLELGPYFLLRKTGYRGKTASAELACGPNRPSAVRSEVLVLVLVETCEDGNER